MLCPCLTAPRTGDFNDEPADPLSRTALGAIRAGADRPPGARGNGTRPRHCHAQERLPPGQRPQAPAENPCWHPPYEKGRASGPPPGPPGARAILLRPPRGNPHQPGLASALGAPHHPHPARQPRGGPAPGSGLPVGQRSARPARRTAAYPLHRGGRRARPRRTRGDFTVSEFHGDSAFRHEALQQLIRVLEKVREDDRPFDMSSWYDDENSQDIKLLTMPAEDCGTASCAAGWAARDPWFIERGFKLVELNEDDE